MTEATKAATAADVNEALAGGTPVAELEGDAAYYCPGCGKRYDAAGECVGGEFGHAPIAVVSTKELAGDADKLTPAPNTD